MSVVFITNYFNSHLKELCDELSLYYKDEFIFFEIGDEESNFEKSRVLVKKPAYVKVFQKEYLNKIDEANVVIAGCAPFKLLKNRIRKNKLTFLYQERPLKKGIEPLKYIPRYIKWHLRYGNSNNCYILCASSFTSSDYAKFNLFKYKCLRFGYFPNRNKADVNYKNKDYDSIFVGRLVDLKHPEIFLDVCSKMIYEIPNFKAAIVGDGPLYEFVSDYIAKNNLNNNVHLLGYLDNKKTIEMMVRSKTLIFCSDRREGWGAVVNESMSCGCVPFVNKVIGSAEFLIDEGINGFIFENSNDLFNKLLKAFKYHSLDFISKEAKSTIDEEWNGIVAARRLIELIENLSFVTKYKKGPVSLIEN